MKYLLIGILIFSNVYGQTIDEQIIIAKNANTDKQRTVRSRAALQANTSFSHMDLIYLLADTAVGDQRSGLYYYDSASTKTIDTVLMNYIAPNSRKLLTGRWVKVTIKEEQFRGGIMTYIGSQKEYLTRAKTDVNGQIVLKLTTDTSTNGPALFKKINFIQVQPDFAAAAPSDAINGFPMNQSTDGTYLKNPKYGFYKINAITLLLSTLTAGAIQMGPILAGPNIEVKFLIKGN